MKLKAKGIKAIGMTAFALSAIAYNPVFAQDDTSKVQELSEVEVLKSVIDKKYPDGSITEVNETPMAGIYEVVAGKNIFYTDIDADFLIFGSLYDMKAGKDITAERRVAINKIQLDLPKTVAMKEVKGNGERVFSIFTDPDCPFCARLESTLEQVDNVTIYRYLMPIPSLHPNATTVAKKIWCSSDDDAKRTEAFINYTKTKEVPENDGSCETPLDQIASFAEAQQIRGTPTLVHSDGRVLPGAAPLEKLNEWLSVGQ